MSELGSEGSPSRDSSAEKGAWLVNYRDCPFPTIEPPRFGLRIVVGIDGGGIALVVDGEDDAVVTARDILETFAYIAERLMTERYIAAERNEGIDDAAAGG